MLILSVKGTSVKRGDEKQIHRRSFVEGLAGVVAFGASSLLSTRKMQAQAISQIPKTTKDAGPGPTGVVMPDPYAGKKKILAIGDVHTGYQHDSVSHALATIERLGRESGQFITYIRTDTQLITKRKIFGTGKYAAPPGGTRMTNAKNLDYFDAVFFYGLGEEDLSPDQKADLLSFVRDDGKGFVGAHSAIDAFYNWPQYGEMMGAYFDNHPWGVMDAPVIVEQPSFPGMSQFSRQFVTRDEIYVVTDKPYSRDKVDVLARLDSTKIDLSVSGLNRTDRDFPIAWVKKYGRGNVFYSSLGHPDAAWDDPGIQHMYLEAIKWAVELTQYTPTPHPVR